MMTLLQRDVMTVVEDGFLHYFKVFEVCSQCYIMSLAFSFLAISWQTIIENNLILCTVSID